jgi:hypothetical protein
MELHDDNLDHFEFALKFMYTQHYDKDIIEILAGGDKTKRVLIPIGIHAVADKYDIARLYEPAAKDFVSPFKTTPDLDNSLIKAVVHANYSSAARSDTAIGKSIGSIVLERYRRFVKTDEFDCLVRSYPVFGADITLCCKRDCIALFDIPPARCSSCTRLQCSHADV